MHAFGKRNPSPHPWLEPKFEVLSHFEEPHTAVSALQLASIQKLATAAEIRWLVRDLHTEDLIMILPSGMYTITDDGDRVLKAYRERSEYNRRRYYELNPSID